MGVGRLDVSVVMAVHNGAQYLAQCLDSVLAQDGVSLEFIIVDDGSTDSSPQVIERYAAADHRVRVIRQANQGLTRSLMRGCSEALGTYIARQDADDVSLPGRFRMQADLLERAPALSLVGCWTRYIGPRGEDLGDWFPDPDPNVATRALRCGDLKKVRSLGAYGSAMFRRLDYLRVGGYRPEFYFAQDLDLWLRLTDAGMLGLVPHALYEWRMSPLSITGRFRPLQVRTARLILAATRVRYNGGDEGALLKEASLIKPGSLSRGNRREMAPGLYFIGKRLLAKRDSRAAGYLSGAALARPWHLRSWAFLLVAIGLRLCRGWR